MPFINMTKTLCVLVLAFCAAVQSEISVEDPSFSDDSIQAHWGSQELKFHADSGVISSDDELLSQEIRQLERAQNRNIVADAIQNFLESFRDTVINGKYPIPPLDPLQIEHIGPLEYSATGVRVAANLYNFNIEGLQWYVVDHVTFNTLRLALGVRVTIPWITFTGDYDAFARITLVSHSAGGKYRIFINRLQTTVDIRVGTNILGGGTLILRELNIDLVINDVNIQINGMVGSSVLNNLINTFVQNAAQNLLKEELETISQTLSRELFEVINEFLADFTLEDLLG